jgi:hypothetical protein
MEGMRDLLDQIQLQRSGPKSETDFSRFVDESVIDELDREGFYRKLMAK